MLTHDLSMGPMRRRAATLLCALAVILPVLAAIAPQAAPPRRSSRRNTVGEYLAVQARTPRGSRITGSVRPPTCSHARSLAATRWGQRRGRTEPMGASRVSLVYQEFGGGDRPQVLRPATRTAVRRSASIRANGDWAASRAMDVRSSHRRIVPRDHPHDPRRATRRRQPIGRDTYLVPGQVT
jgi:hypothetical protein